MGLLRVISFGFSLSRRPHSIIRAGAVPPPIRAVESGVAAFIGSFAKGPVAEPTRVDRFSFSRLFAGRAPGEAQSAVQHFLQNAGQNALLVRTAEVTATPAAADLMAGLEALAQAQDANFDLLCLPDAVHLDGYGISVYSWALALCRERGALLLVDVPPAFDSDLRIADWIGLMAPLRGPDAALYFPRVLPLDQRGAKPIGASGAVAGVIARTDRNTGVWKAPAGAGAALAGTRLTHHVSESAGQALNLMGVNTLRAVGDSIPRVWGARTLVDGRSEWLYLPVRRTGLLIEQSLRRGLGWVVFEPNEQPLWDAVRTVTSNFLLSLWHQGALTGGRQREAFFVRCGLDTMTQPDIDAGRLILEVGFAPLKPAEFVVLRIELETWH